MIYIGISFADEVTGNIFFYDSYFVGLCFVRFVPYLCAYFTGPGAIIWLVQCRWMSLKNYEKYDLDESTRNWII